MLVHDFRFDEDHMSEHVPCDDDNSGMRWQSSGVVLAAAVGSPSAGADMAVRTSGAGLAKRDTAPDGWAEESASHRAEEWPAKWEGSARSCFGQRALQSPKTGRSRARSCWRWAADASGGKSGRLKVSKESS